MADKKNLKLVLKSDGTPEGTSLMVNGVDITQSSNVVEIGFSTFAESSGVYLVWKTVSKDASGALKFETYSVSPYGPGVVKVIGSPDEKKLGDKAEPQFESQADRMSFNISGQYKKISDAIEITDGQKK